MSDDTSIPPPAFRPIFEFLPVGFFGSAMGLTGLSVAWHLASERYGVPGWIATSFLAIACGVFVLLCIGFTLKAVTAPDAFMAEFRHPIAGNLFGTIPINLLLLPIGLAPFSLPLAQVLWVAGAAGMIFFAVLTITRWIELPQQAAYATPAWIIPVVGLLDLPLAIPVLNIPNIEVLAIFALAVGLFFTIPLFTLILSRLLFEPPIPGSLRPSLMILVAPFSVGYSAYASVTARTDIFATALFMLALFLLVILAGQMRFLRKCCPFRISWWAVSFPLAATSVAALRFAAASSSLAMDAVALALLALSTLVIVGLFIRTMAGVVRGELRTLSG